MVERTFGSVIISVTQAIVCGIYTFESNRKKKNQINKYANKYIYKKKNSNSSNNNNNRMELMVATKHTEWKHPSQHNNTIHYTTQHYYTTQHSTTTQHTNNNNNNNRMELMVATKHTEWETSNSEKLKTLSAYHESLVNELTATHKKNILEMKNDIDMRWQAEMQKSEKEVKHTHTLSSLSPFSLSLSPFSISSLSLPHTHTKI